MVSWMLHTYMGGTWDLPLLFYRNEYCLLLLNSNIDAALLWNRMRLSCFQKRWEGMLASGWRDKPHKHCNECCLGQWWKSQFLYLELSEHLPWKDAFWKKSMHMSQTYPFTGPKRTAQALQMRLSWASLFCFCSLRFPKMVPHSSKSSSSFCCSSDSQLLSVFLLRRVPEIFQALSGNHVGDGCP